MVVLAFVQELFACLSRARRPLEAVLEGCNEVMGEKSGMQWPQLCQSHTSNVFLKIQITQSFLKCLESDRLGVAVVWEFLSAELLFSARVVPDRRAAGSGFCSEITVFVRVGLENELLNRTHENDLNPRGFVTFNICLNSP